MIIEMDDPYLGKRKLDLEDRIALVQDQLKMLKEIQRRNSSPNPVGLQKDIWVYEYILAAHDPIATAELYFERKDQMREATGDQMIKNHQVADNLKWKYQK